MKCPNCGGKTYIIDTRPSEDYEQIIRRRRACEKCKKRFTTYEARVGSLELEDIDLNIKDLKRNIKKIKDLWQQIGRYLEEVDS